MRLKNLPGDERLPEKLRRIRTKFRAERAGHDELLAILRTRLAAAGNPTLMTPTLVASADLAEYVLNPEVPGTVPKITDGSSL